jgi:iron complex outermembrane recepter protein
MKATNQQSSPCRDIHAGRAPAFRLFTILFLSLSASLLHAAVITGTVSNKNTQRFLERAIVEVQGTQLKALTLPDGSFRIAGVPAGTHTVTAGYTDLDSQSLTVTVSEESPASVSFELTSAVYQLDTFVVTSTIEGSAFAVNQQRRAESARSVTSIDAFIDQATGNPGEFLKNVEGIQMVYSQNEPQSIRVRGFHPNLTMVTMDGNEIASAASSSANRAVQIDQLSIASIESVEVYKAPIPSMSANAIGGAVNFITKSAFDQKGRRMFAQVGVNMDSNDFHFSKTPGPGHGDEAERRIYPAGRLQYSNSFFNNRLGIMASVGLDQTNQLGSSTTHNLNVAAPTGGSLPAAPTFYDESNAVIRRGNFSMAPNRQLRDRWDLSLNTDFKLNDAIVLFLKTTYSDYHSTNRNHGFTLNPGSVASLAPGSTLEQYTTTNGAASQGVSVFDKFTKSWQLNPGLKYNSGDWKAELVGGFSKSTNHYRNDDNFTGLSTTLTGLGWTMTTPRDTDVPTSITQTSGDDFYNLNNYRPNQGNLASTNGQHRANHGGFVSNNKRDSRNMKYSGRFDLQRDFQARFPFYLKAGLSYNETIFDKQQDQRRWYWMGQDGIATADDLTAAGAQLGRFAEPVPVTQNIPGWTLREPTYFSTHELWKYWQANPQVLQENLAYRLQQEFAGRQKVNEQVRGYYFMGSTTINKLNILAGVRIEETDVVVNGYRVLPTTGATSVLPPGVDANSVDGIRASYRRTISRSSYRSDPFKYLHLRYEITPDLQVRASYTDAIGRPNLSDLIPGGQSQNDATQIITANNRAGLLPQNSQNLDASIEYYTKTSGQWTFGVFSRDVDDYISEGTVPMTPELLEELNLDDSFANYQVRTKFNLGNAKWSGFEFKFTQSLREFDALPKFLHGITLWANYTKIAKMEGDFGTPGAVITELAEVVPELYNAGFKYRSPRGKIEFNLSTNFQGKNPRQNLPARAAAGQRAPYQEDYQFWNMDLSYRINDKLRLTAVGRNIFSERPIFSEMGIIRNTQQATGIAWMFAAKYDL